MQRVLFGRASSPIQREILSSSARYRVVVAARRSGKTTILRDAGVVRAAQGGRVWYVAPTWSQVRTAFWEPLLEEYSPALTDIHRSGMRCRVGSGWLECRSADRPENLRGVGLDLVLLDEYQSMHAHLWDGVIQPTLVDRRGRAIFAGTPQGRGSHFHELYEAGQGASRDIRSWLVTAYDAGRIPREQLDADRLAAESRGPTSARLWRREMLADWDAFVGQVFEAWSEARHVTSALPATRTRCSAGVDWGFTGSHPGVLEVHVLDDRDCWWVVDEVAAVGQTIEGFWLPRIREAVEAWRVDAVWCDPARPDAIAALRRAGIAGVREANNAVMDGVIHLATLLESDRLRVHERCALLRRQMIGYRWDEARDGTVRERPRKAQDDAVDAVRYALHSEATRPVMSWA